MRLMGDCRDSLSALKRAEGELEEDESDLAGLNNPETAEPQNTGSDHTHQFTATSTGTGT